jgi:MFS family permease
MLILYFGWITGACALLAASRNVWMVAAGLTLLGAGASLYHPVGLAMLSLGVRRRGRAMGIHGVAGSVGVALGAPLGIWAAQLSPPGSWRLAYAIVGAIALVSAVVFSRIPLRRMQPEGEGAAPEEESASAREARRPLARMLPVLYAAMVCGGVGYRALVTVLPTFLVVGAATAAGLQKGGWATLAVLVIGGAGQLAGGQLSDRTRPASLYLVLILAALPFALLLGLGLDSWTVAWAALLAFFTFSVQPVENNLLARATSTRRRATLYGLKFAPAFGLGAVGTPAVGWIWESTGRLSNVFLLITGTLSLMSVLAAVVVLKTRAKE